MMRTATVKAHWHLDDPEVLSLEEVRRVRDEIREHVQDLLQTLEVVPND